MSTNVTLHAGHDVAYFTSGQGRGGCAGAMSYYTAAGEPPGRVGREGRRGARAERPGRPGRDRAACTRTTSAPAGSSWSGAASPRRPGSGKRRRWRRTWPRTRTPARWSWPRSARPSAAADPHQVPYFDLTVSAVKSVSVLHASYRVCARQARERGDDDQAAALDARAGRAGGRADGIGPRSGGLARAACRLHPDRAPFGRSRGSGGTAAAWSPACSCTTCPATATRSCMCTSRSGTGSSAPTAPTTNGGPWTPAPCTASGSAWPRSPTGSWRPG